MKLTAQIQLNPTPAQADALKRTLETANAACNAISTSAWEAKTFRQFDLHKIVYYDTRAAFGLSAEMTIRAISKVADGYKLDRNIKREFASMGAIAYNDHILSFNHRAASVSIWTMDGRQHIPYVCGERQRAMLQHQKGESDLIFRGGKWYLFAVCDMPDAPQVETSGTLGVDLGIVNLATDSDGETFSGAKVESRREWYATRRQRLQAVGTKSAKRRLKRLSGRQRRFQANENHRISKQLVAKAKGTKRTIAIENLKGIRERITARKTQRARHSNWAFGQLRAFLTYKAQQAGIPLVTVDPRNTSRTCAACGHCEKANRRSQSLFVCVACGHTSLADYNAALNIERAAANRPMASDLRVEAQALRL